MTAGRTRRAGRGGRGYNAMDHKDKSFSSATLFKQYRDY